ncbi:hypothetical protein FHS29_007272 [Saccharothrix tamanrassetensis]|uniref:Resolvase/invertase-type recombinase catalytic domain-containing protein n=1 Tax=Saccharothrix tamanrassetensis TaxID=1051531 RepID=A0A841CWG2_9PSEU|nr:hypothetical protein [Saccharothrix tamanrassetensis]MBB5960644.1 hypothetical protein [Saccharothrix tamanrassetensis]
MTSRAWRLEVAQHLTAGRGTITATFFDAGRSRRDRWRDRLQVAELLAAVRDPGRGFDAIVVGEYERGFAGDQLERLQTLFRRHGAQLWLPEAGGPVDLETPEHRALVRMLGAQSLREVIRAVPVPAVRVGHRGGDPVVPAAGVPVRVHLVDE